MTDRLHCSACGEIVFMFCDVHMCRAGNRYVRRAPDNIRDVVEGPIADKLAGALWAVGKAKERLREQLGP